MATILKRDQLASEMTRLRQENKKIVTTNGCFDILHVGHISVLNNAKAFGDVLIVGINSDASVKRLKGLERPLVAESDRAEVIAHLLPVDYVTIFDEDTPIEFLKIVKPDIHVKGGDYDLNNLAEVPVVRSFGGDVKLVPIISGKSTTGLIDKIKTL
jgi:D-glycero-beta-D-manno-heptose 1-phosphate adenylyltransferase